MLVSWLSFYVTVSLRVCVCVGKGGGGGLREKGSPSESKLVCKCPQNYMMGNVSVSITDSDSYTY